jgi:hypothetical protein
MLNLLSVYIGKRGGNKVLVSSGGSWELVGCRTWLLKRDGRDMARLEMKSENCGGGGNGWMSPKIGRE